MKTLMIYSKRSDAALPLGMLQQAGPMKVTVAACHRNGLRTEGVEASLVEDLWLAMFGDVPYLTVQGNGRVALTETVIS